MRAGVQEAKRQAHGIVIRHGAFEEREPAAFWAYMWTEDQENADAHWHERVPVDRGGDWRQRGRAA